MTTICFDVNGTLVTERGPRYEIIHMLLTLKALGHTVYVWSDGGAQYAGEWVQRLGLEVPAVRKGDLDPDVAFDDMDANLGTVNVRV